MVDIERDVSCTVAKPVPKPVIAQEIVVSGLQRWSPPRQAEKRRLNIVRRSNNYDESPSDR
jgi:hypothetical protein